MEPVSLSPFLSSCRGKPRPRGRRVYFSPEKKPAVSRRGKEIRSILIIGESSRETASRVSLSLVPRVLRVQVPGLRLRLRTREVSVYARLKSARKLLCSFKSLRQRILVSTFSAAVPLASTMYFRGRILEKNGQNPLSEDQV